MSATDDTASSYEAVVCREWKTENANPPTGRVGEQLDATDRVEDWREIRGWTWRWCRDSHGREGWVAEALLVVNGPEATLREDYDARELTVAVGARLIVERELAGWALCRLPHGVSGWIPLECLTRLPE